MNIKFSESPPKPIVKEDIIVDGETVGWVESTNLGSGYRFHVGFNLPGKLGGSGLANSALCDRHFANHRHRLRLGPGPPGGRLRLSALRAASSGHGRDCLPEPWRAARSGR